MKIKIEEVAINFKNNPASPVLQEQIAKYIINKFTKFINKQSFTYTNFEQSDVDSIIADIFVRIQNNISKWDETSCLFTTWLFSCIGNEIKAYYTYKSRFYNKVYTESRLLGKDDGDDNEEREVASFFIQDIQDTNDYNDKKKIKIIKKGYLKVGVWDGDSNSKAGWFLYDLEDNLIDKKRRLNEFKTKYNYVTTDKSTDRVIVKLNTREVKRHIKFIDYIIEQEDEINSNDDFEVGKQIIRSLINTKIKRKERQFMIDYYSKGDNSSYNDLGLKYNLPLTTVKNRIHKNNTIIKEEIRNNTKYETIFKSR